MRGLLRDSPVHLMVRHRIHSMWAWVAWVAVGRVHLTRCRGNGWDRGESCHGSC